MLEERDNVGKRLVEGEHIGVRWLLISRVEAVEQGMGRFMGYHIVGDGAEYPDPGNVFSMSMPCSSRVRKYPKSIAILSRL